jgi:tetratricopeptide (TPR) repeat protein
VDALMFDVGLQNKNAHEIFFEAETDLQTGDFARAEKKLRISLEIADTEIYGDEFVADVQATLGVACHSQGKLDEAEIAYRQALRIDPKAHACWANLASLLGVLGQAKEAVEALNRAKDIAGNDADYDQIEKEILSIK